MNLELAEQLPGDVRDEYVAVSKALESDGWEVVREHLQRLVDQARADKFHADTWERNRVAHGAYSVLQQFLMFVDSIDDVYTEIIGGRD